MSQCENSKRKMFRQYRRWLNNDTFTKEVAAFEYMKRNPYFITVASLYKLNLEYKNMGEILHVKQLLQQIFLYTGFDIDNTNKNVEGYSLVERYKDTNFKNMDGLIAEYHYTGENYYYSGIYKANQSQYYSDINEEYIKESKSALNAKKEYPIDLNFFHNDGRSLRWLEHLLPSMNIKINPYLKQDDLKSALTNLIKQIDNETAIPNTKWKLSEYAAPNALLDIDQDVNVSLQAPTFQSLKSLVALIMYDLINIHKVENFNTLKEILEHKIYKYTSSKIKKEFERYFSDGGIAKDCQKNIRFNYKHKKNNLDNVIARINGQYLDYIYPLKSKRIHRKLLLKEYKDIYSKENVAQDKKMIMNAQNILKPHANVYMHAHFLKNYTGIIQLACFGNEEYKQWSNDIFSLLEDEDYCDSIFSILLL